MNGPSTSDNREIDIVKEAQCIIDRYALALNRINFRKLRRKRKMSDKTLWFFAGISTSAALFLALLIKIY